MAKKAISFALVAAVALLGSARSSGMTQLAATTGQWVATDKADYAPGSTVHITGGNWQPGEDVRIVTNDTLGNTWSQADSVTADGSGAIADDVVLPNYFVSDYTVTATAPSGAATTTFTDAVNYQFLGKDGLAHNTAGAEEDLGSLTSGSSVSATCPTGLTAKGTGLGGGQSSSYAIGYASGYGDDSTLSSPGSRTQITPAAGTFNGNGSTCTSLTISTTGLASGTYHGELQLRNTGGATATTELYFFEFTIAPTQQPTSISAVSGAGTYGGNGSLTATLKSGTTALSGKTIGFTLNGSSVGSATTDAAGVATLGGVSLGSINAGTQNGAVGASFAGDSGFSASSAAGNLSVAQAASTTTVTCPGTSLVYDGSAKAPCSATVTGVGGLNQALIVGYSSNTGAGTATASASYAGDANHTGSSDSKTFTIGKASSATTLNCPSAVTYDGSPKTPCSAKATGAGGLDQSVAVDYSNNIGAGTATATATFSGDANHDGSSSSTTFTVQKAEQTITFDAPFSATYGRTFQVQPTASSGLAVALGGTAGVCSITADAIQLGVFDVHMLAGTGTCNLGASQAGDGNYNAAAAVSRDVAAEKANQSITFDALADRTFGDADFAVSASSSSGLALALAAGGDCSISGSIVHLSGAGSCTITASQGGDGNYDAAADVPRSFTIAKAPSSVMVTCDAGPFTYTGSAQTPCSANVTGVGGLDEPVSVAYSDNVAAGTAAASATYPGDGNHTGSSGSATFTIEKAQSTVTVTCPGSRTYTGDPIEPCSANAAGAGGLDAALAVTYANNLDAGTASASATYEGDANHTGNDGSSTFTIDRALSHVTVTCPAGPFVYTGGAQTPCSATVTGAGGLDLVLTVGYANNVDAGTAAASASYDGDVNHTGDSDSTPFTIEKAASTADVSCTDGPFTFDGSPQAPCSAKVTGAGGLDQPLAVTYSDNTAAGTATASASYGGDANHTGDSGTATFTIDKAPSTTTVSCPDSRTYTGSAIEPCTASATGVGGLDTSVPVSYTNNVDAGTATASAAYAGDTDHLGSSGSATFTITKAPSTVTVTCAAGPFTYDGGPQTPCSAKATGAGGLNEVLSVAYADNTNAGTATASAAYAGDANHFGDSSSKTFTIGKATPSVTVTWNGWTYDGAAHAATGSVTGVAGASLGSPAFTYYSGSSAAGTPLPGPPSGVGTFTVLAAYGGSSNYTTASKTKTVSGLYRWDGFLQPINDTAHQGGFESYFKLGSTVPAKFQLKKADGTVVQAGTLPTFSRSTAPVSCDTQVAAEVLDGDAGFSGTTFRWDGSQYIYNWSTKGLQKGEYRLYATLDDGSKQYVDICLQ